MPETRFTLKSLNGVLKKQASPSIPNPKPESLIPKPQTPKSLNPKPQTSLSIPNPKAPNPKPQNPNTKP